MDNVFIGYNTTVLPNVRIGENVIIGACSTVTKDLPPGGVYVGSPAKKIGTFDDFVSRLSKKPDGRYDYPYVSRNQSITQSEIDSAWRFFTQTRENR